MASYEVEHSIPPSSTEPSNQASRPRRPDLSTFFSALSSIDTSTTTNQHAVPTPGDVSAAFRLLADAFSVMRRDGAHGGTGGGGGGPTEETGYGDMMEGLIERLMMEAEMPPREVKGCGEGFVDALERVPKNSLKPEDVCPICNNPFLDDPYPLIVRLPCHSSHIFDLECIQPWLKLHTTCPLDRTDLVKLKEDRRDKIVRDATKGNTTGGDGTKGKADEVDEEEWDGMYA
ncbi:MAG: hypothetical protein M1817_003132 [Caeruleum heppii]|nr:MAG: hypothetical protein M1817_003132 [Caeruleum heppii]